MSVRNDGDNCWWERRLKRKYRNRSVYNRNKRSIKTYIVNMWCENSKYRMTINAISDLFQLCLYWFSSKLILSKIKVATVFRIFLLFLCRDMIATGCEDKNVRVYYLATSSDQPLKVFAGHLAKVFHVRWSPLREGILCSGSDDGWVPTQKARDNTDCSKCFLFNRE